MAVTSTTGNFSITGLDSTVVVRDASVDISRDTLETTNLGDSSRTYVTGLRGASGSATLLYENSLLDDVYAKINTDSQGAITATLTLTTGKTISGSVLITSVGSTVTVGDVTSTNVAFTFTGDLTISST
jgi:hypothetical protein|tara:strand:- start:5771 stop:6157 length:387 start_codon:yes stop_codon:yes gene_type:complete